MTFENDVPPPRKPRVFKPDDVAVEARSDDAVHDAGSVTARRAARVPSRHLTVTDINRGFRFGGQVDKGRAGRLIRHESDAGVLVIGDTRLVTKGYGRQLLAALPSMRPLQSEPEFLEALDALTRASTMDRSCP